MERAKELINEAIADKLDLKLLKIDTSSTFRVADLGCSTGPNTFIVVQNIIEAIELKLLQANRLFPKSTLHIINSSYALHWLSKIPKEIAGGNSLAWNRESIRNKRFVNEVAEAYSAQFKNDIESLLNARAQELVAGGLMFILIVAVPDGIPLSQTTLGVFYDVFGSCLMDMAKMGITSEEKINSFNIPNHRPTPKELESIIKTNKYFTIERMEQLADRMSQSTFLAKCRTSAVRAVYEGVVMEHFGSEFVEPFFNHFTVKVEEKASRFEKFQNPIDLFVLLKRTGDELN
ncbi:putative S-adenosylmethionine-dependent methyltransferase [Citrus sinensis]|uniref:S-adenosylmethionine-dependent methyltransferase n=1 Tax=Citrus sinensis TaxID=2711 RepID=A0ACB8KBL7_CITSI|nr:putative S-adenosylmethionine-dependent methyltransferase [Citrus sinensis]